MISNTQVIAEKHKECRSLFSKALGLMFSRPRPLVMRFSTERYVPLHMMFVFGAIDVLFLDKEAKVVEIKEDFRPWTFYNPKKKAMTVVELPAGFVRETGVKLGQHISIS